MANTKTTPAPKLVPRKTPAKTVNFFFTQEARPLHRKWGRDADFWRTASRQRTNEPPRWAAFDAWRDSIKSNSKS